jgi:hypothetical protein
MHKKNMQKYTQRTAIKKRTGKSCACASEMYERIMRHAPRGLKGQDIVETQKKHENDTQDIQYYSQQPANEESESSKSEKATHKQSGKQEETEKKGT